MLLTLNAFHIYSLVVLFVHTLGIGNAAHAVMNVRSSRGAVAWAVALVSLPWLAIPLYWIFGRSKFQGYSEAIRQAYSKDYQTELHAYEEILKHKVKLPERLSNLEKLAHEFTGIPFTSNNSLELLLDGQQTFPKMLEAIANAQDYILLQSYIIHDDAIGNQFKDALIERTQNGVKVRVLYDGLGSKTLTHNYIKSLRQNNIEVNAFRSTEGRGNRFQINFRNHRKILVVDGKIGFIGGLNIGDEYLGRDPHFGYWRDTHLKVTGTIVKSLQETFLKDWYWATKEIPLVNWEIIRSDDNNQTAFILPTSAADRLKNCTLFYLDLINLSQERIWIASPYFVPDDSILDALKLAAVRGVDVRIILPDRADHLSVYLCSFSYYGELQEVGIKLYRYKRGFMHQKIILCDRFIAGVGTVNLDNRSFFLNFEVMAFAVKGDRDCQDSDLDLVDSVEQMLVRDFQASRAIDLAKYRQKSILFKLSARVTRLSAPIL